MSDADLLEVGHIAKAHGLHGEVIVALSTDRHERLEPGAVLDAGGRALTVVAAHVHQHRWRVRFEGVGSREEAEALRGTTLRAAPLDDDETWFVHELIGLPVVLEDATALGTCAAVLDNPAHDLLELDDGTLIPLPFVVSVDDVIVVAPPEGLLDLAAEPE